MSVDSYDRLVDKKGPVITVLKLHIKFIICNINRKLRRNQKLRNTLRKEVSEAIAVFNIEFGRNTTTVRDEKSKPSI